jgi:hypothetical protein
LYVKNQAKSYDAEASYGHPLGMIVPEVMSCQQEALMRIFRSAKGVSSARNDFSDMNQNERFGPLFHRLPTEHIKFCWKLDMPILRCFSMM